MIDIDKSLSEFPRISLNEGDYLMHQGEKSDNIYFLVEGEVKIVKDGFEVGQTSLRGAVFGEMSITLDSGHSASVQCVRNSTFCQVDAPIKQLEKHPEVIWQIVHIMSLRLFSLNQYFVQKKREQESGDYDKTANRENMINEVLKLLQIR